MYYQQKKSIVSIVISVILLSVYYIYIIGKLNAGAVTLDDAKFFAVTMLIFIGIGIVATIAVQIIFHILFSISIAVQEREKDSETIEHVVKAAMVEDERDKLIDLKSSRITVIVSMFGFVVGLLLLALDYPFGVMLNIFYGAAGLGAIGEDVSKLIYYRVR
ncbi:MAG TPA: hypothetical protein PKU80_06125 [Candidatus Limiplasma sp.]|nr:hypothetical protein [Candidatus Limiplasma sp.]HRX09276.1 hypothetical protein [Candidatus Limiplasma sp.]